MFVGYPRGKKRRKLYELETREIFVSRDVRFYENKFSYVESSTSMSTDI